MHEGGVATGDLGLFVVGRSPRDRKLSSFAATGLPEVRQKSASIGKRPGTGFPILEAEFTVIGGVKELYRVTAFRSWRMMGRADARRATTLNPRACANAAAVPVKIFDVLFGALVSIG